MIRIENLKKKMIDDNLDGFLVTDKVNWRYLCGFTGSNGLLFVTQNKSYLIVDGRYIEQAKKQTNSLSNLELVVTKNNETIIEILMNILQKGQKIGFERHQISYSLYQQLLGIPVIWVETSFWIEKLRQQKTMDEINKLQKAAAIADEIFAYAVKNIKPGISELEFASELDYYGRKIGGEGAAFETIVASGIRTSQPHAHASKKIIKENELIMLDFGVIYEGYYSDITRTFALGEVDESLKKIYRVVKEAQEMAIAEICLQKQLKELDYIARKVIEDNGYGEYFSHGLGHGIGLSCHEYPYLSLQSIEKVQPNMVFTIEPGVYVPQLGGVRIEDDIWIDKDGMVYSLTKSSKEWRIIE